MPTALRQYADWVELMEPGISSAEGAVQIVLEGLNASGVAPTRFELKYLTAYLGDPIMAVILHGWLSQASRS